MALPRNAALLFSSFLRRCCPPLCAIRPGRQTHAQIIGSGLLPHVTLQTDLLLMYSRCSDIDNARKVFDEMALRNMHSWNILISAYVQSSLFDEALKLFLLLLHKSIRPDHFTLPSVFKACGGTGDFVLGVVLHGWVVKLGHDEHVVVGGSVLDMYAKCGKIYDAHRLFARMCHRDVVAWNSMVSGFVRAGLLIQALRLYREMQWEGMGMDPRAVPSVLCACGRGGELRKGKEIHSQVIKTPVLNFDIAIGNSLIDMYGKCGCVDDARKVFSRMPQRNLVTWTTLISCYGVHGKGEESLRLYKEMIAEGLKPNCVTFTSVLASCCHSGLVDQGRMGFESMVSNYGVEHQEEHYACMVDLLGRSGNLEEALNLIKGMPMEPTASVWGALLGACLVHKNIKIAETAACRLFDLEVGNASNYIALCSIYDALGMWDGVSRIRSRMRELGLVKTPGCSWISIQGRVHSFCQGDTIHQLASEIYGTLQGLLEIVIVPDEDHG